MARRDLVASALILTLVSACGPQPVAPTSSPPPVAAAPSAPGGPSSSSPSPSVVPSPSPEPTAGPSPTPAAWQRYRSKRYHYRLSYPPDWVVTPGSAKFVDTFDGFDYPYVYVSRDTVSGTVSVARTVASDRAYYRSHYKARVVSDKPIKVAGWSGRIVTYAGRDGGFKLVIQRIVIGQGRVAYFLTMHGDAATLTADRTLFRAIYRTFKPT